VEFEIGQLDIRTRRQCYAWYETVALLRCYAAYNGVYLSKVGTNYRSSLHEGAETFYPNFGW